SPSTRATRPAATARTARRRSARHWRPTRSARTGRRQTHVPPHTMRSPAPKAPEAPLAPWAPLAPLAPSRSPSSQPPTAAGQPLRSEQPGEDRERPPRVPEILAQREKCGGRALVEARQERVDVARGNDR